jgi:hypothetical protein
MEALGEELGFNWKECRLWCAGYIINLVARLILYSKDMKALEDKLEEVKDEIKYLKLWRKQGLIGKLYNIIVYISSTLSQRE